MKRQIYQIKTCTHCKSTDTIAYLGLDDFKNPGYYQKCNDCPGQGSITKEEYEMIEEYDKILHQESADLVAANDEEARREASEPKVDKICPQCGDGILKPSTIHRDPADNNNFPNHVPEEILRCSECVYCRMY